MIATTTTTATGGISSFLPMILLLGAFFLVYTITMRPQRKQYKNLQAKREMMKKGDKVVTAGGFHGKVFSVKDNYAIIEVLPDNVKMKINKTSISEVELREVPTKKNDEAEDIEIEEETKTPATPVKKANKNAKDYSKKSRAKKEAQQESVANEEIIDAEIVEEIENKPEEK
jgi:preprotein translocase subunit YajC